ncbi:MAG: bifunctional 2',3'-cyclic-nucleotide 2'-phosphodiesterase/3'-nucleotidase [Roseovarius sp.]|uniref:bifunctional 2',3'-cyclic-nucleotide 2'-phosphodiesterase/3'-nucleotidase n=1 Tax=Roseovarius sp. TaxID=1486281 RepID=UPI0032EB988B
MNSPVRPQPSPALRTGSGSFHLRLLATSDIHAAILPYDYAADRPDSGYSLACIASLVDTARAEAPGACLLVDNGDFLQGSPLSDLHDPEGAPHPVIAAMNRLGYDAANLGNHEFNFGLPTLRTAVEQAAFPVLSANTLTRKGATPAEDETLLRPATILTRTVTSAAGETRTLNIGLIGLLPPQITLWDRFHLGGEVTARDMVDTAAHHVPALRAQGADIVILLAHTGIDTGDAGPDMENAALTLARLPGVDAIVAGHSHELFPHGDTPPGADEADHLAGTFSGIPAVLPGYRGSHLGQIDLDLAHDAGGWSVSGHRARLHPVLPGDTPAHPAIAETVRHDHAATLARMRAPLGHTDQPIHSYLSLYRADLPVLLVAEAKRRAVRQALSGTALDGLPVLAATAPFNTGGRAGPRAYTDIPAGDLTLRNAADLQPFPNSLCALRFTGAEVKDWLERAASCFHRIAPGQPDQPLWNNAFPGHAADTIAGLTYRIDLSAPPLYDDSGRPLPGPAGPGRIRDLAHEGRPVAPADDFVVAVNNYRAFGGGPYPVLPENRLVHASQTPVRDLLAGFFRDGGHHALSATPAWRFLPLPDTSVLIWSGPGLRAHPADIAAHDLTDLGLSPGGFLRLRMPLDTAPCESAT